MKHGILVLSLAAMLPFTPAMAQERGATARDIGETARDAAMTPVRDLNLAGEDIPPVLANLRSPYEPIANRTCSGIRSDVTALDDALGPDADVAELEERNGLLGDIGDIAGSVLSGALLPFRGIVRRVSGADDRDDALLAAQIRGVARRSYLKGVGQTLGCNAPAAPTGYIPPEPEPDENAGES